TPCQTVRKRFWMRYSKGGFFYSSSGGWTYLSHGLFAHEEISFPVAQMVRQYNLALTLLPMYQEHNAFHTARTKDKRDFRGAACDKLSRPKETDSFTFNGTSYDVHLKMIDTPVDYEALRQRVMAELGLTAEEYAAEKEKYYAANDIYKAVAAGDFDALKAYSGDLKRPNVAGRTPLNIAAAFSAPDHPNHDVYIYLLRKVGDIDVFLGVALAHGIDYLRENDIPFDEAALQKRMEEYYQMRVDRILDK
ncbi:MAG TPA: hypothetical protein VHP34_04830, partial [Alphaproteobacteria bacterium]|nr:hypothetical protein [Alphaproteobacteria bacterium]